MSGGASEEMTEYRTMPRIPKAVANKIYALTKAPFPKTLRPHCQAASFEHPNLLACVAGNLRTLCVPTGPSLILSKSRCL